MRYIWPKLALLIVHGMGDTAPDFHDELIVPLRTRLQSAWDRIAWRPVYYQPVLQQNERAIFEQMRPLLRWEGLRELMLFGFSDAASLEHKKELALSPYWHTQRLILQRLDEFFDEIGDESASRCAACDRRAIARLPGHVELHLGRAAAARVCGDLELRRSMTACPPTHRATASGGCARCSD